MPEKSALKMKNNLFSTPFSGIQSLLTSCKGYSALKIIKNRTLQTIQFNLNLKLNLSVTISTKLEIF